VHHNRGKAHPHMGNVSPAGVSRDKGWQAEEGYKSGLWEGKVNRGEREHRVRNRVVKGRAIS